MLFFPHVNNVNMKPCVLLIYYNIMFRPRKINSCVLVSLPEENRVGP